MIQAVQRLLAPLRAAPPEPAWQALSALAAERDAVRAVSAFIASPGEDVPPRVRSTARPDGLSGARTLDMIAALEDAGRDVEALAHLGLEAAARRGDGDAAAARRPAEPQRSTPARRLLHRIVTRPSPNRERPVIG